MRALQHPAKADLNLPSVLFALSDPTRLHIVKFLAERDGMICSSVDVPLSKSSCSRHFKVLRESGIIQMRPQGTAYLNSLRRAELNERFPGLLEAVLRSTGEAKCAAGEAPTRRKPSRTRL